MSTDATTSTAGAAGRKAVQFFVPGIPKPGGSKRAFVIPGTNRASVTEDCKTSKTWKQSVAVFASQAFTGEPIDAPLFVAVVFVMPRIRSHFRTGKHANELRPDAPLWHTVKPDGTKLMRSTEDALTGILWRDDALIVAPLPFKVYGSRPGAHVIVRPLGDRSELPLFLADALTVLHEAVGKDEQPASEAA